MGTIQHDALIAVLWERHDTAKFTDWRDALPPAWQRLAIGPVETVVNCDTVYAWLPDGSKEWWPDSNQGDEYRAQFIQLIRSLGEYPHLVGVSFGELGDVMSDLTTGADPRSPAESTPKGDEKP